MEAPLPAMVKREARTKVITPPKQKTTMSLTSEDESFARPSWSCDTMMSTCAHLEFSPPPSITRKTEQKAGRQRISENLGECLKPRGAGVGRCHFADNGDDSEASRRADNKPNLVQGLRCRVKGLGFGDWVRGLGFGVWGLG